MKPLDHDRVEMGSGVVVIKGREACRRPRATRPKSHRRSEYPARKHRLAFRVWRYTALQNIANYMDYLTWPD